MINLSNGLIGLSMLTGNSSLMGMGGTYEPPAVLLAKKAFTTRETTPPWRLPPSKTPTSTLVSDIKRMKTIIDDKPDEKLKDLPDVQTSFTTYKALDRLRLLAETAAKPTTSSAERKSLQDAFAKGLADLQNWMGKAASDKVKLAFGQPARRAESIKVPAASTQYSVPGKGVLKTRDAPIPGLTGNEKLKIDLSKYNMRDSVTIDLSQTPQPPTLDSVANAINAAIKAVPMRDADGNIVLDGNGQPRPRWQSSVSVDKGTGDWGLKLNIPGSEKFTIDQVGAKDALVVATGQAQKDKATTTQLIRFNDANGTPVRQTLGDIAAIDRRATEQARLTAKPPVIVKPVNGEKPKVPEPITVHAPTTAQAVVTDKLGNSYIVGTTTGDLGANRSDGGNDLFLTKTDSEGRVIWQRTLGAAGKAEVDGAALSLTPDGDVVVTGTVKGPFNGKMGDDTDMLVARFDANGEEEFATTLRALGDDRATAVTVGTDGSIYVGGRASTGGGDAFVARLDAKGALKERRVIDSGGSDTLAGLAIDSSGALLALTREGGTSKVRKLDAQALSSDLGSISLGTSNASAITVSATGEIAVAGTTSSALTGAQVNGLSGGEDGFVTRIDAGLAGASTTYIGSAGRDQIDSVVFMNGAIHVGGRTTGDLNGPRTGTTDGFVARIDGGTGAIGTISQFGRPSQTTEPVRVAAASGGSTILGALGLQRGTLNQTQSPNIVTQTSLRAGDEFSVRMNNGKVTKIRIEAQDSFASLAKRIQWALGKEAKVTTPTLRGEVSLQIEAKPGSSIELIGGGAGKDALSKLGMTPGRITAAPPPDPKAPKVTPGGSYGLLLTDALTLSDAKSAGVALKRVKDAISTTQTAYRSLYWDDTKAGMVSGFVKGGGSVYQKAQLAQYQAALSRLSGGAV